MTLWGRPWSKRSGTNYSIQGWQDKPLLWKPGGRGDSKGDTPQTDQCKSGFREDAAVTVSSFTAGCTKRPPFRMCWWMRMKARLLWRSSSAMLLTGATTNCLAENWKLHQSKLNKRCIYVLESLFWSSLNTESVNYGSWFGRWSSSAVCGSVRSPANRAEVDQQSLPLWCWGRWILIPEPAPAPISSHSPSFCRLVSAGIPSGSWWCSSWPLWGSGQSRRSNLEMKQTGKINTFSWETVCVFVTNSPGRPRSLCHSM